MSPSKLLANIQAVCTVVPSKVPQRWSNVRSISIKTTNSVALPIYNKTPEELEQIRMLAREDKHDVVEAKLVTDVNADDDERKSKGKNVASTPLAKALKKQQATKDNDEEVAVEKSTKSSKKKRKEAGVEEETDKITTEDSTNKSKSSSKKRKDESTEKNVDTKKPTSSKTKANNDEEVPKSSKKKRKDVSSESTPKDESSREQESVPKSSKKSKSISTVTTTSVNEDANFIASKTFAGAKRGYVFKKCKLGLGYYKDVLPVVDKVWLSNLGKSGGGAGGRGAGGGRKSMGHSMQKKKGGGKSRKSY